MLDLVTFGEAMAVFFPEQPGPLESARTFVRTVGGAEANVAAGLSRLGYRTGWFGRVGADELGRFVLRAVRGEGVDTSRVRVDREAPTGLLYREVRPDRDPRVFYYRRGSAGSRLSAADIDESYIAAAKWLHVTGITPALGPACREASQAAMDAARRHGVKVGIDPNLRLKLWTAPEAAAAIRPLLAGADLALVGLDEGRKLTGRQEQEAVAEWFLEAGARLLVLKLGAEGAQATDGRQTWSHGGFPARIADSVGAGDAFAAGFYAALFSGRDPGEALRWGNAAGAIAVQSPGDFEAFAYPDDLAALLGEGEILTR